MTMKTVAALASFSLAAVAAQAPPFSGCNATDYYGNLLRIKSDPLTWTRKDITDLVVATHRNNLPNVAPVNGDDDILLALQDLFPGTQEETVSLIYRAIDFPAIPAGSPNTWKREDLWPIARGVLRTSPALTDVHGKIPADYTVLFIKSALFFGECGTVESTSKCRQPATSETAEDTESDGKIFAPPRKSRGDIARALFYTQVRYAQSLGLRLTDCPPFGNNEFGYLSSLLKWHQEDPVSDEERARNDRACSRWQGNRNPFVDYPELVARIFGEPDTLVPGGVTYSRCTEPTSSPTATPNACSSLRAGDTPLYLINSDNPDQIVLFPLTNIDEDIEYLYITDNAWTGERLLDTEGTWRFSIPNGGIKAGQAFGFGLGSPFRESWELLTDENGESNFDLDTAGDQVFVYCLDADNVPNFLWGFSYNGPWSDSGLRDEDYGTAFSALPPSLESIGSVALEHRDNCVYDGELAGRKTELQRFFMDPASFTCDDDSRIRIKGVDDEPSSSNTLSLFISGAVALAALIAVLVF